MNKLNPTAILFIATGAGIGYLCGNTVLGAVIASSIVLLVSLV